MLFFGAPVQSQRRAKFIFYYFIWISIAPIQLSSPVAQALPKGARSLQSIRTQSIRSSTFLRRSPTSRTYHSSSFPNQADPKIDQRRRKVFGDYMIKRNEK